MKNIKTIFKILLLTACAGAALASCVKEAEDNVAKAVLGSETMLNFPAKSASPKTITVISDKEWHITAPDWISVNPETGGSGATEVSVCVTDNVDAQGTLEPRKDSLIFGGNSHRSQFIVIVSQEGDAYRNAEHLGVEQIAALADDKSFILDEATVAALSAAGYVITDGKVNVYVSVAANDVKVGDKVSLKGCKGSVAGVPVIKKVDGKSILSSGTFTYPDPVDISSTIATYEAKSIDYITVNGIVTGSVLTVTVDDVDYAVKQIDCPAELKINALGGNKVELTGYSYGIQGAKTIGILTTAFKDNGPAVVPRPETLLHAEWLFSKTAAQDQTYPYYTTFGNKFNGTVVNTNAGEVGYVNANVSGIGKISWNHAVDLSEIDVEKTVKLGVGSTGHPYIYGAWPGDFWLFEATDNYEYPAGTSVHINFLTRISEFGQEYWTLEYFDGAAWQPVTEMQTVTIGGAEIKYNFMPVKTSDNSLVDFTWTLAAPCSTMKFRYTCAGNSSAGAPLAAPSAATCRIAGAAGTSPIFEVTDAPDGPTGGGVVFSEDFEWLEPITSALGAGDAVANNAPGATAPSAYDCEKTAEFVEEFTKRGYSYFYSQKGDTAFTYDLTNHPAALYLQRNYLKFGRSDINAGLILPALSALTGSSDVTIEFDWCWQVTGSFNPDIMTLQLDAKNGGTFENGTETSAELTSTQSPESKASKIEWQHATVKLKGATSKTVLHIRPTNPDPYTSNKRGQNRWYLDNIKITK